MIIRKKVKALTLFTLVFLTTITLAHLFYLENPQKKQISCSSETTFHRGMDIMSLSIKYEFHSGTGVVFLSGTAVSHGLWNHISRKISFAYHEDNDNYTVRSIEVFKSQVDDTDLSLEKYWLPPFFNSPQNSFLLKIVKTGNGYLFFSESTPVFFCEKTH